MPSAAVARAYCILSLPTHPLFNNHADRGLWSMAHSSQLNLLTRLVMKGALMMVLLCTCPRGTMQLSRYVLLASLVVGKQCVTDTESQPLHWCSRPWKCKCLITPVYLKTITTTIIATITTMPTTVTRQTNCDWRQCSIIRRG